MPTLASLCSSCHSRPPQYKCPRCGTRTCSLACAKVHKARTLCSGVRDAAAYHSRAELNTAAAFDRDFNFISGVERGIERAARESEARGIDVDKNAFSQFDTGRGGGGFRGRGGMGQRGARGRGRGRGGGGGGGGGLAGQRPARGEVPLLKSLQRDNVTVLRAPKGMTRQRENRTHWRRKGGGVSWTVEWVEIDAGGEGGEDKGMPVLRNRHLTPLYEQLTLREGFLAWRAAVTHTSAPGAKRSAGGEEKPQQLKSEGQAGGKEDSSTQDKSQQHDTDADDETLAKSPDQNEWVLALEDVGQQRDYATKTLLPFGTDVKIRLKELLMGRTVREYPTIYAWRRRRRRDRGQSGEGEETVETEEAPTPGFSILESFEPPEVTVPPEDKERDSPVQKVQGDVTNKAEDGNIEPAEESMGGEDAGDGGQTLDDGTGLDDGGGEEEDDGMEQKSIDAHDEDGGDDDEEDANVDQFSQTGQPQLEMNVQVAADSNLGISGAIATALMADMGNEGH